MKPEERARSALATFYWPPGYQAGPSQVEAVAAAVREAVAEEREACARVIDRMAAQAEADRDDPGTINWIKTFAAAIRARGG